MVLQTLHWRITLTGNHKCKHLGSNAAVLLSSEEAAADDSRLSEILTITPPLIQQLSSFDAHN